MRLKRFSLKQKNHVNQKNPISWFRQLHGGNPDSYREKVEMKEGEGSEFIIQLPII